MPVHLSSITIKNLLSFGPEGVTLDLQPLNVLIGPNGCGKSNILSVISLIQAAKRDIHEEITKGGGTDRWFHKALVGGKAANSAHVVTTWHSASGAHKFRHDVELIAGRMQAGDQGGAVQFALLGRETLQHVSPDLGVQAYFLSRSDRFPRMSVNFDPLGEVASSDWSLSPQPVRIMGAAFRDQSDFIPDAKVSREVEADFLPRRTEPESPSDPARCEPNQSLLTSVNLKSYLASVAMFGDFDTAPTSPLRALGPTNERQDYLLPDGRNLALILSSFHRQPAIKKRLLQELQLFMERIVDFTVHPAGNRLEVLFHEGERSIGLAGLSDGTLRYLCLLAILLHPSPPPLVMIEEPELGLHPDIIPQLGKLLIEASERTQLIITTHSELLVDAMDNTPESVVVCEQQDGVTDFRRLKAEELQEWLKDYRLGELWSRGNLGGNRW